MIGWGVLLVLVGSAAHAGWNVLIAKVPDGGSTFVWVYSAITLAWFLPVAAAVQSIAGSPVGWSLAGACLISALLHIAYALSLQWAYAKTDMSLTYPVARGVAPLIVAVIAIAIFGQSIGPVAVLAIVVIVGGVFVVSSGRGQVEKELGSSALPVGLAVGGLIAAYTLWDSYSVTTLGLSPMPYYAGMLLFQFVALSLVTWKKKSAAVKMAHKYWRVAVAVSILVPVSYVLVLVAMEFTPVSIVAALRGTSIEPL